MGAQGVQCVGESVVVEVLGGMVGPVTEGVLHGFTGIHDEGGPVWNEVFKGGYDLD